jgi:rfaE bifunctional protein nucleotidyltransferase chain/domain
MRERGTRVVSTNGCFDLLHEGHIDFLQACKTHGDCLIVGLNSDDSVRRLKGPKRPLVGQNARAKVIGALECVDYVTIFDEDTPDAWLTEVKPYVHCKGKDYSLQQIPELATVEANGGHVELITLTEGKSTTSLIGEILERNGHISLDILADVVETHENHDWGREHWLVNIYIPEEDIDYCSKILEYDTNEVAGSVHLHRIKHETFKVLSGRVFIGREYMPGEQITIPRGYLHFAGALSPTAAVLEASSHHEDKDTIRVDLPFEITKKGYGKDKG